MGVVENIIDWVVEITRHSEEYVLCVKHSSLLESDIRIVEGMSKIFSNHLLILSQGKHDTLTGLLNRRVFLEKINRTIHLSRFDLNQFDVESDRRNTIVPGEYWLAIFYFVIGVENLWL